MDPTLLHPAALPAPAALLAALQAALLALHLLPVSLLLGGGLAVLAASARAEDPAYRALVVRLSRTLAAWTAAAASTGAGLVLVVLALEGRDALPAAVVMAWPWISVVALVSAAAVGRLLQGRLVEARPVTAFWLGALATLASLITALVFTSHSGLALRPEQHLDLWLAGPGGATLDLSEPALWPRFLHLLTAAAAGGALLASHLGARLGGAGGRRVVAASAAWLAGAIVLAVVSGTWALLSLPKPALGALWGGDLIGSAALEVAAVLSFAAAPLALLARRSPRPQHQVKLLAGLGVIVLLLMGLVRDSVRRAMLAGRVAAPPPVLTDWAGLVAFGVALLAAAAALAWLWRAWRRAPAAPARGP